MFDEFFSEWAMHDRRVAEQQLNEETDPQKRKELEEEIEKAKRAENDEFMAPNNWD